ncbi:MAG: hypothetical protein ABL949_03260 [Fimbriimonadaceae bacterium]
MTLATKLFAGTLVGACIALVVSGDVRSLWLAGFIVSRDPIQELAPPPLVAPKSPRETAQWVLLAAEKLQRKLEISSADWRKLDQVLADAARKDAGNAFWHQSRAAFEHHRGHADLALEAWSAGAKCNLWNDFQVGRTLDQRRRLDSHLSAWSAAVAYGRESLAAAQLIELYARALVKTSPLTDHDGLERRFRILQNGDLIRKFARTVATGEVGARIVETAAYPSDMTPLAGPHKLLLARLDLQNKLKQRGMKIQAEVAESAFRNKDGWAAYASEPVASNRINHLRWESMLTTCAPGACLWAALAGAFLWLVGWATRVAPRLAAIWRWPVCVVIGSSLGVVVILTTDFELAGLAFAGAFCFLGWRPLQVRPTIDLPFGPLYRLSLIVLGAMIALCVFGFAIGLSRVGWLLCEALQVPAEYYGASPILSGLAALTLGLLVGIAPTFGWAYRIDPARIASATFESTGRFILIGSLCVSIVMTPISMFLSARMNDDLSKMIENEPVFYLSD